MEKMYEVLRFVEKGTECQPSIDCLQGELLIYYLRDNTQLDKAVLFEWFRQIAGEIRKYQQSRRGQNYRCLTPYSIVVTEEGELLLLNPDAQENEFVMKKMQQKAVRSHFIRPTASGSRKNCSVDLFGYGKILQFLLAYTEQIPELSRSEERRLERIIERCTGGGRRHYDKISQVIRDLPEEREEWNLEQKVKFRNVKLAVLLFAAGAVIAAAGYGLKASMHFAMQPDPVDYGEWKSGVNTAGTLSAVNGFIGKVGMAIASSIGAALLQFGGFDANLAVQTTTAQHYITAMYIWVPIITNIATIITMMFYDLDKIYPQIVKELDERRVNA